MESFIPDQAISFIAKAGSMLTLPSATIARAMYIYHRFNRCIDMDFDNGLAAASAIALCARTDAESIDIEKIVTVMWKLLNGDKSLPGKEELEELAISVTKVQYLICRALKFELNHLLAHQHIVKFLKKIHETKEIIEWDEFVNVVWKVLSVAYTSKRCLNYDSSEIALVTLFIAGQVCQIGKDSLTTCHKILAPSMKKEKLLAAVAEFTVISAMTNIENLLCISKE